MVFSSLTFLLFFLPVTLLLVGCSKKVSVQNALLSFLSLVFYTWGDFSLSWILLISVGTNFLFGIKIGEAVDDAARKRRLLTLAVTANLTLLLFFKYANFGAENLNYLLSVLHLPVLSFPHIPLPLGISFFTFHCISYLVDIYRGKTGALKDPVVMFLYIALFPQLVAGPIIRYHEIASQFVTRKVNADCVAQGMRRFIYGLSKKVLVANPVGAIADRAFAVPLSQVGADTAWLAALCYALQIYFDFSGYSDMAIGLGRMFGFTFPENFNFPYIATSIRDFWRRWHITLSSWFRDYVYIPLGGNKSGRLVESRNLLTVFFLCGLWHGASWNFVIWGLFHGIFLSLERTRLGAGLLESAPRPLCWLYSMLVVLVGWVFFRLESLPEALTYVAAMFALKQPSLAYPASSLVDGYGFFCILTGVFFSMPLSFSTAPVVKVLALTEARWLRSLQALRLLRVSLTMILLLLSTVELTAGASNPFIYFRF